MSEEGTLVADRAGNRFRLRSRPCPVCGVVADDVVGLRGGEHHRYGEGVTTRIVRCRRCGLLFPDPFPYPLDVERLYGDPESYFQDEDPEQKRASCRELVREMGARLGRRSFTLLDVGSGRGELLAAARDEEVLAVGLELSPAMVEAARERFGVEVLRESIEHYSASGDASFDVVALAGVLEHAHDPDSMIACASRLTRPGGLLYVDVPREPNLVTLVGNVWNRLRGRPGVFNLQPTWPPYHVFGFNPRCLRTLLSKHGFAIQSLRVRAEPHVPARGDWKDRAAAFVASQVHRIGNVTGTGANMFVWARREGASE